MSIQQRPGKTCEQEKEELKLKFELLTNKYSMFEGSSPGLVSEKLRLRFAKTKKELHDLISAL